MTALALRDSIQAWLHGPGRTLPSAAALLDGLCHQLQHHGLELRRVNMLVRTRQPQLEMMVYIWRPSDSDRVVVDTTQKVVGVRLDRFRGGEVETVLLAMGHTNESTWQQSPFHACLSTKSPVRRLLVGSDTPRDFPILHDLEALGVTDYFVMPVQLPDPYVGAISIATARVGGFRGEKLQSFQDAEPLIALGFAYHVVQQADIAVLAAYIGVDPARRVMAGAVQVGDSLELEAVIGFTDLRGFTRFSSESSSAAVVQKLTTFFSAVHEAVSSHGGEVLKFMGDGAMFVFPISGHSKAVACQRALKAMDALRSSLPSNVSDAPDGAPDVFRFATALHPGTVLYGNIGSVDRLDFTVLGSAVNQTARMEPIAKQLRQAVVVSSDFAAACPGVFRSVGHFPLRGLSEEAEIFVPMSML